MRPECPPGDDSLRVVMCDVSAARDHATHLLGADDISGGSMNRVESCSGNPILGVFGGGTVRWKHLSFRL